MHFFLTKIFILATLTVFVVTTATHSMDGNVRAQDVSIFSHRLALLRRIALTATQRKFPCSQKYFLMITEYQFGNSGNNLIEFTHMLWLAKNLNRTLIIPNWMKPILKPFDTTLLESMFCYIHSVDSNYGVNKDVVKVTSEDSFFMFKLFDDPQINSTIPKFSNELLKELSRHFIQVYTALWSSPVPSLLGAGSWILSNHLNNSFSSYVAAHKRSMEGGCGKILGYVSQISDYSPKELPMDHILWSGNLRQYHPLCVMPAGFVLATMAMHNRTNQKIFLAFDGNGDISDYIKLNTVFSSQIDKSHHHKHTEKKFLDMLLAIHSEFFIMNPRSTYSWEIFVVRECMRLESVPKVRGHDFYMQKYPEDYNYYKRTIRYWVSWTSIMEACQDILSTLSD
jgi:hypothetical protein